MERAFLYARLNLWETLSKWKCTSLAARGPWSAFISENPVQLETTALERRGKSRQKPGEMCGFCLPLTPNPVRAVSKVEQNHPKSEKCSTRVPSPKQCDLRLQANSQKNVLPVTEVRYGDWADDAQRCICQNHCRLRTHRWKWTLCP